MSSNSTGFRSSTFQAARHSQRHEAPQRRQRGPPTPRPNYFFAVQINDSKVLEKAKTVQEHILSTASSDLSHMIVDIRTSHLTLMAMYLQDSSAKEEAIQCLQKSIAAAKYESDCRNITLEFEGLDAFNEGGVLFINVKPSSDLEQLTRIADAITTNMEELGIMAAGFKFNPHMSLMKYTWNKAPRNSAKKIDSSAYSEYENEYFGSHTISSVQLCKMGSANEWDNGYYEVDHEVFLKYDCNKHRY